MPDSQAAAPTRGLRTLSIYSDRRRALPETLGCGRCFDVVCASASLLVLAPVFALIALLILVFDGRPVLFRQERVGRLGTSFGMWKFRTMRKRRPGFEGSLITAAGDPRITKLGAWLRRLKVDELPQLYNILAGEMSVVGPRPEVSEYVNFDDPSWKLVLSVRPGLTDLATLIFLDEEETLAISEDPEDHYRQAILPRKLALNVSYLRQRSRRTDLRLVLLTMLYILRLRRLNQDWTQQFLS